METGNPYWPDQIKSGLSFFVEGDNTPSGRRRKERRDLIGVSAQRSEGGSTQWSVRTSGGQRGHGNLIRRHQHHQKRGKSSRV